MEKYLGKYCALLETQNKCTKNRKMVTGWWALLPPSASHSIHCNNLVTSLVMGAQPFWHPRLPQHLLILIFFSLTGSSLLRVGSSLVAGSRGYSSLQYTGFLLCCRAQIQGSQASVVVVPGLNSCSRARAQQSCTQAQFCSVACRIFLDQGSNPYLLHCQGDPLPQATKKTPTDTLLLTWGTFRNSVIFHCLKLTGLFPNKLALCGRMETHQARK